MFRGAYASLVNVNPGDEESPDGPHSQASDQVSATTSDRPPAMTFENALEEVLREDADIIEALREA